MLAMTHAMILTHQKRLAAEPPSMSSPVKVSIVCAVLAMSALSCKEQPAPSSATTQPPPVAVAAKDLWSLSLVGVEGAGKVSLVHDGKPSTLTTQAAISPGDVLQTAPTNQARYRMEAGGELVMGRTSEVELLKDRPGLRLERGHVIVRSPFAGQAALGQQRRPVVMVGAAEVELTPGAHVAISADSARAQVIVARGQAQVQGSDGVVAIAGFGQRLLLDKEKPPQLGQAPQLPKVFGWSERTAQEKALPTPELGMGKLVAHRPGQERELPLDLKDHQVKVSLQGMMAYTEITEVFSNPTGERLEGLYRFPLPADAQISRLALKVGSRIMEGQFLENKRAQRIWDDVTIVREQDPALLKWQQGDQFELRIFPIEPHSTRQVTIGYVQRLERTGEGYSYVYPMPVDRTGQSHAGRFMLDATLIDYDKSQPLAVRGYEGAQIKEDVDDKDRARAHVTLTKEAFSPSGALALDYALKPDRAQLAAYTYKDVAKPKDDAYVAMTIRPDFKARGQIAPRDFVIVVDSSYSQRGTSAQINQALVSRLLEQLEPSDRVRVLACAERCVSVGPKQWLIASRDDDSPIKAALSKIEPQGSSYTVEAMRAAARVLNARPDQSHQAHVIYLSDGISSAGALDPGRLGEATSRLLSPLKAQLSVVNAGGSADVTNLRALATSVGGQVVTIDAEQGALAGALAVLRHHYGQNMRQVSVELPPGIEQVYPTEQANLLPGEELLVVGRLKGEVEGEVKLVGDVDGERVEQRWPITLKPATIAGNSFVPRLWAKHRIEELERSSQGSQSAQREIVALSAQFGILTRYTSLLALEDEQMMRDYNVSSQRHVDWLGDEAADAADLGDTSAAADAEAPRTASTATAKREAMPAKPSKAKSLDLMGIGEVGSGGGKAIPKYDFPDEMAPRRRHRRQYCFMQRVPTLKPDAIDDRALERQIERARARFERTPDNRTARMAYIRALLGAGPSELLTADKQINDWLAINGSDPEAVVLRGQIYMLMGQGQLGLRWMSSGADMAARGKWLQSRLQAAYEAIDDGPLACAHQVSLDEINGVKNPLDVLSCQAATGEPELFEGALSHHDVPPSLAKRGALKGQLSVELKWSGDQDAVDLVLIEPSGRPLSWMSQRRGLKVSDVRSANQEFLAIPTLPTGAWRVRVVRTQGSSAPITLNATIKLDGKTQRFERQLYGASLDLAHVSFSSRRVCR